MLTTFMNFNFILCTLIILLLSSEVLPKSRCELAINPLTPIKTGLFDVGGGHTISYAVYGKQKAKKTIIYVHGGPGSGTKVDDLKFFNLDEVRVILLDQRSSGKSIAPDGFVGNRTKELVEDMEKLRRYLNIEKWQLFGGSWGSTLSLLYAQTYPARVSSMVLRGIFLARSKDVAWLLGNAKTYFPNTWKKLNDLMGERGELSFIDYIYEQLKNKRNLRREEIAQLFAFWETALATGNDNLEVSAIGKLSIKQIEKILLEVYYLKNGFFMDGDILDDMLNVRSIPTIIVQGGNDNVASPGAVKDLASTLDKVHVINIPNAGHSPNHPKMEENLIKAVTTIP